ncbi:hypothetical protein Sango_1443200 [Sesamum angolense]|uniref:Methyltransferase type 11 domain-containing protein n=1 Tax=Sesamum angolense TaxID=2727404 RepID=A0AAE2BSE8_9LAMI|nr:hypothetical protein Sango_1443200 [Sesamum angolense]
MEPTGGKPSFLRNILVRLFLFCVLVIALRFAYVVTIRGESCDVGDFCFFTLPENFNVVAGVGQLAKSSSSAIISSSGKEAPLTPKKIPDLWATEGFQKAVQFYSSVFQDLMSEAILSPNFKTLCVDTTTGADVFALKEIGVEDSVGISKKGFKPLVISGQGFKQPFGDETFDFVFCGGGVVEKSVRPGDLAAEIGRTMKPEGLVKSQDFGGFDSKMPFVREIVLQKFSGAGNSIGIIESSSSDSVNKCSVPSYKLDLVRKAEPLIEEEPKKPWITLKKNVQKIKYLPSMVDISFKPKNETLYFEINGDPGHKEVEKGRGMGRIQPVQSSDGSTSSDGRSAVQVRGQQSTKKRMAVLEFVYFSQKKWSSSASVVVTGKSRSLKEVKEYILLMPLLTAELKLCYGVDRFRLYPAYIYDITYLLGSRNEFSTYFRYDDLRAVWIFFPM